jgi:serine/threonine kinase 32
MEHSLAVDYYAVGVIAYELMLGKVYSINILLKQRPYSGRSKMEIKEQMLAKQAVIKKEELPFGWSEKAMDFVNNVRKQEI